MYGRGFPRQKLVSPVPSALLSGTLDVQGARWSVEGWPGMIGHNWGEANSEAYAWGHCNAWDDGDDVVFEGASRVVYARVASSSPRPRGALPSATTGRAPCR